MQLTTASQHLFPRWPRAGRYAARLGASVLLVALAACGGADDEGARNGIGLTAPSHVSASASSHQLVSLAWDASTSTAAGIRYQVLRSDSADPLGETTAPRFDDATVVGGTRYTYRVRTLDAAGNASPPSAAVDVTTPDEVDKEAPSAPSQLAATAVSAVEVDLTWTASTDNVGVIKYRVFRDDQLLGESGTPRYEDHAVSGNTRYRYTVKAVDAANNASAASNTTSVTTPALVAPAITAQPLSVAVHAGEAATFTVQATGTAPLQVRWQRATGAAPAWADISGATQASLALPAVASGDSGSQYRAVVSNAAGSATSAAATLTVLPAANAFYVSLSGSNGNPGTQARPWRTIAYAASSASAAPVGATIYVQAGNYGNENVTVQKDGISLIGYRTAPGDQPAVLANTQTPFAPFDPAEQPLLDGGDRATGIAINLRGRKNVTLKNISITRYKYGVLSGNSSQAFVENHLLFNVNLSTLGGVDDSYSGLGMSLGMMGSWYANGVTVRNSLIVNAAAEGLTVNGNNNVVDNVKVYCNDTSTSAAATDYYIMVTGNDNIVENSLVSRKPGLAHNGHGFSVKSNAEMVVDQGGNYPVVNPERNLFRNNVAYNLGESFVVRHRGARFNVFRDNKAYGPSGDRDCEGNAIVIRDGASDNEFYNTTVENACSAVRFNDTVEDGDTMSSPPGHPGNRNIVDGVKATNVYYAVNFNDYSIQSDAGANVIRNSEFVNTHLLFNVNRHATRMRYANSRFAGRAVSDPGDDGGFRGGSHPGDVVPGQFENCAFENIRGGVPSGF